MDTKRWSFKVPGGQDGSEKTIDISRITSVHELLAIVRGVDEAQEPGSERKPLTAPVPFSRRLSSKGRRRHPSA
ncbi:hypothetical protein NST84_04210 [Paenibacillus sp. FSL R7-0345]|uniref:hypothetical protein n=1 Tax=Paenibacillus sp. FSL R7-0345 TaxID=2954535 RepID=UPI00315B13D3